MSPKESARTSTKKPDVRSRSRAATRALKAHVEECLDQVLKSGGIENPADVTESGVRWFTTNTVEAFAYTEMDEGDVLLRVVSEIMPVPSDRDLNLVLMRQLLELNAEALGGARFAISGSDVYASVAELADGMPDAQVQRHVKSVITLAEVFGPGLRRRFRKTARKRHGHRNAQLAGR
jgi:hypothetical protein